MVIKTDEAIDIAGIKTKGGNWFAFAGGSLESKRIAQCILDVGGLGTETECIQTYFSYVTNVFRLDAHMVQLILSNKELCEYELYFREKNHKYAFPVGPISAKWLLGIVEVDTTSDVYRDLVRVRDRAMYMEPAQDLVNTIAEREISARKNKLKTFKVCDLFEEYLGRVTLADLKGLDRVIMDYFSEKSYTFTIRNRRGKHELYVRSYPSVHVSHDLPIIKRPG